MSVILRNLLSPSRWDCPQLSSLAVWSAVTKRNAFRSHMEMYLCGEVPRGCVITVLRRCRMGNIRDSAEFATTSHFGMPVKPHNLQLDLVYRNPGQNLRISCRINKHNAVTFKSRICEFKTGRSSRTPYPIRTNSAHMSRTMLRSDGGQDSWLMPFFDENYEHPQQESGEIYWLGPHEVMRIQ